MGETDGPAVVGHDVRNLVLAKNLVLNLAELEVCFFGIDTHRHVAALQVVEHAEVLVALHDLDHVHQTEWVLVVASRLAVDFNVQLLVMADFLDLLAGKSVLESLSEQHAERDALPHLVWTSRRARRAIAHVLVEHPVRRSPHAFQVLLRTSCLHKKSQKTANREPQITHR